LNLLDKFSKNTQISNLMRPVEAELFHAERLMDGRRWDRCVAAQGDYFEGDAAQT
jgi:hypothetical protein